MRKRGLAFSEDGDSADLAPQVRAKLGEETARLFDCYKRELFVPKGGECRADSVEDFLLIVKSGVIAVIMPSSSGKSTGLFFAGPGCIVNIMRVAGDTDRYGKDFNDAHFGYALADSRLALVPLHDVRAQMEENSALASELMAQLTDRYKATLEIMTTMVEMSGADRIKWLFHRADQVGLDPLDLTHEMIDRLLGMNRVSVTRLMGKVLGGA